MSYEIISKTNVLRIIKVDKNDLEIIKLIVDHLLDGSDEKASDDHLLSLISNENTYILATIIDDQVIGYTLAYKFPSLYASNYLAYLYDIEVLENHRRKGAGKLMIKTLLEYLKVDNVGELWLETAIDNIEGQGLITSTGAIKSGETFNDYTYEL